MLCSSLRQDKSGMVSIIQFIQVSNLCCYGGSNLPIFMNTSIIYFCINRGSKFPLCLSPWVCLSLSLCQCLSLCHSVCLPIYMHTHTHTQPWRAEALTYLYILYSNNSSKKSIPNSLFHSVSLGCTVSGTCYRTCLLPYFWPVLCVYIKQTSVTQ